MRILTSPACVRESVLSSTAKLRGQGRLSTDSVVDTVLIFFRKKISIDLHGWSPTRFLLVRNVISPRYASSFSINLSYTMPKDSNRSYNMPQQSERTPGSMHGFCHLSSQPFFSSILACLRDEVTIHAIKCECEQPTSIKKLSTSHYNFNIKFILIRP